MHDRPPEASSIAERLQSARAGSRQALGEALDACRHYLLLVANQQLDSDLRGKVGPSDLVQETFLEAQRDFEQFHGRSEEELLASQISGGTPTSSTAPPLWGMEAIATVRRSYWVRRRSV